MNRRRRKCHLHLGLQSSHRRSSQERLHIHRSHRRHTQQGQNCKHIHLCTPRTLFHHILRMHLDIGRIHHQSEHQHHSCTILDRYNPSSSDIHNFRHPKWLQRRSCKPRGLCIQGNSRNHTIHCQRMPLPRSCMH